VSVVADILWLAQSICAHDPHVVPDPETDVALQHGLLVNPSL
jgi:hypothetical protein